jgi:hypothetical protein
VKYFVANRVPGEKAVTLRWLLRSEHPDRLTVEQVRSATNTWLSAVDLKPAARRERFEKELNNQRYHQRRNKQGRKSHTKTRITRLNALGIDANKIKSCTLTSTT